VYLRKFVRSSKHDDLVEEVELTHVNPTYAYVRHNNGRESTVSLSDLAPCPRGSEEDQISQSESHNIDHIVDTVVDTAPDDT